MEIGDRFVTLNSQSNQHKSHANS